MRRKALIAAQLIGVPFIALGLVADGFASVLRDVAAVMPQVVRDILKGDCL